MIPVRVEFDLRTPMVVPNSIMMLDGLLSWAAVREADFAGHDVPWSAEHNTGLARHVVGEQWCPMASAFEMEWISEPDHIHYIKRQRSEDYCQAWLDGVLARAPRVDTSSGLFKAALCFQQIRWAKTVLAWAVVQDMDRFRALLPWATHVGKLWHKDMGAVRGFEVHEDPSALDRWSNRPLPVGSSAARADHVMTMGALASPYWKRERHQPILMPSAAEFLS